MIRRTGPAPGLAAAFAVGAAWFVSVSATFVAGSAFAGTVTIDVVAPRRSRLAEDLRRELGASGFVVVFVEASGGDWSADVRRLPGSQARRGVVVRTDEKSMIVFTRVASSPIVQAHLDQPVDPHDRLARRRACLSVLEYLRVLSESDRPGAVPPRGERDREGAAAPSSSLADWGPLSASAPPLPAFAAEPGGAGAPANTSATAHRASPAAAGDSLGGLAAPALGAASSPWGAERGAKITARGPAPGGEPSLPNGATGDHQPPRPSQDDADYAGTTSTNPADLVAASPERGARSQIGVGSTLGLEAAPGGPTGHLEFLWYLPLDWRLATSVRVLWPVLGGQFRAAASDVRAWSFGGALSLQYLFAVGARTRLRPFVGAVLGTRIALTETTPANALQSRETFTPSLIFGGEVGVRYDLGPPVQLFVDVGVARGWLIPGVHRADYEEAAANAESLHASLGVLFEI